jgi:hypothetical protein
MAAVRTRHQFDDGAGFAMTPDTEHNALIGPFHESEHIRFRLQLLEAQGLNLHGLNHPTASPVNDRYSPKAVNSAETASTSVSI